MPPSPRYWGWFQSCPCGCAGGQCQPRNWKPRGSQTPGCPFSLAQPQSRGPGGGGCSAMHTCSAGGPSSWGPAPSSVSGPQARLSAPQLGFSASAQRPQHTGPLALGAPPVPVPPIHCPFPQPFQRSTGSRSAAGQDKTATCGHSRGEAPVAGGGEGPSYQPHGVTFPPTGVGTCRGRGGTSVSGVHEGAGRVASRLPAGLNAVFTPRRLRLPAGCPTCP